MQNKKEESKCKKKPKKGGRPKERDHLVKLESIFAYKIIQIWNPIHANTHTHNNKEFKNDVNENAIKYTKFMQFTAAS